MMVTENNWDRIAGLGELGKFEEEERPQRPPATSRLKLGAKVSG